MNSLQDVQENSLRDFKTVFQVYICITQTDFKTVIQSSLNYERRQKLPTTLEVLSFYKFFNAYFLKADANKSYVVFIKPRFQLAQTLGAEPTKGSSKPSQKHDDTGSILPKCFYGYILK